MARLNEKNNFLYLTAALLVLLLALPLLDLFHVGFVHWIVRGLVVAMMLVTYFSLDFGPWWGRLVGTVMLALVVSTLLREFFAVPVSGIFHLGLLLIFFVCVTFAAAGRVLLSGSIDGNKIIGGAAIYLLLGLIWAMLYLMVLVVQPEALNGIKQGGLWEDNFFDVTYFSFVTLTTLGYGDISPNLPIIRALAYLEALTGTFYMAVVVASLIGARANSKADQPPR